MKTRRTKFLLYTNPNNVTSCAYTATGAREVREVLQSAREYPDSYKILYQGTGTEEDMQSACKQFSYYRFV
jgi:hypothetical protein